MYYHRVHSSCLLRITVQIAVVIIRVRYSPLLLSIMKNKIQKYLFFLLSFFHFRGAQMPILITH